jgi:DNA-binding CsgD family transcriptional regulator
VAAAALVEEARDALKRPLPGVGMARTQEMLVSMAAIRDGWGDPVGWLRECEAFFVDRGFERIARRCRLLLGEAGAPIPRRSRSGAAVPPSLRALGVTSREVEVLGLVADGMTTKEISERLVISARTVERHVENLFARMGVRDRAALASLARAHGLENG